MDWTKFFSMGGYAFYVWGSYGVALIGFSAELFFLVKRRKSLERTSAHFEQQNNRNK